MSKAIIGAAEIGLAIAGTWWVGGIGGLAVLAAQGGALAAFTGVVTALAASGIAMEAGAIAAAIGGSAGIGITTRQAAGLRQIIYGMQRVGGTTIYQSTTGTGGSSGDYVYNYIIVLASHVIDGYVNLYLDGRQVFWAQTANPNGYHANVGCGRLATPPTSTVTVSGGVITGISATGGAGLYPVKPVDGYRVVIRDTTGSGAEAWATNTGSTSSPAWTVAMVHGGTGYTAPTAEIQGAFTFGGTGAADDQNPADGSAYGLGYGIGPGGPHYNFAGKVYCEARFGDQVDGDVMASLTANDSTWAASGGQSPWVGGCAYLYVNVGYDTAEFPNAPEIKVTMTGKSDIYDPRTTETGYSTNWALQVADVITDPVFGLGDNTVNQAQLIASANVCDESVVTSQGDEANFAQHIHYDTGYAPGDVLATMMTSAAGRLSRIGGEWYIFPGYWQGPSFTFDESTLLSDIQWNPYRSVKDLINVVNGTYVAPNSPYNVAGNLYDSNGWWYGTTANLWPLAWQPTNFPPFACDALHGFGTNVFLTDDGGIVLPKELTLRGVISIVQAQRVASIELLRNRQQGTGNLKMSLAAWQLQPLDVMALNFPLMNWVNKNLEVTRLQLLAEPSQDENGQDGAIALSVSVDVQESDPSVYEWDESEELTPYDVPAAPGSLSSVVPPPTDLVLTDNNTTAITQQDGTALPRLLATWVPPLDIYVQVGGTIQVQWQDVSVEATLVATSSALPEGTVGTPYTGVLLATGGETPYTWTVTGGTLPAGLTLATNGNITGNPTTAVSADSVTFTVTDSTTPTAMTATATIPITISLTALPLSVSTTTLPNGVIGTAYSQTLAATGGTSPYTWTVSSGTLPTDIFLTGSTGVVAGTPTVAIIADAVTFEVTDSASNTATQVIDITINSTAVTPGPITAIPDWSWGSVTSEGTPLAVIVITGDGSGATATATVTQVGSMPYPPPYGPTTPIWAVTSTQLTAGGTGYTIATATLWVNSVAVLTGDCTGASGLL